MWLVHLDAHRNTGVLSERLSEAERATLVAYQNEEQRRRYIVAHAAVRQLLQAYVGASDLSIIANRFGKPHVVLPRFAPQIHFSLSHAASYCLIGFARSSALGVDIERLDRPGNIDSLAAATLSESEYVRWRRLSTPLRREMLLQTWTCKEAVLKAIGVGLTINPRRCEIMWSPDGAPQLMLLNGCKVPEWSLGRLNPVPSCAAAWAAPVQLRPTLHAVLDRL